VLARLRADFVTAWVLGRDLEALAARGDDPDLTRLCTLLRENYAYPVDSVLVTPELEVVGHLNVHEPAALFPVSYRAFLARGLALARGEPPPEEEPLPTPAGEAGLDLLRPTPEQPIVSLLDVFRAGRPGELSLRYIPLDLSAFLAGGELELEARVGGAGAAAKFELCASPPGDPSFSSPVRTLERVAPGESATLTLAIEPGRAYGLAVMAAAGMAEGASNAFLATVTMRVP
jgi:hypothetical protein